MEGGETLHKKNEAVFSFTISCVTGLVGLPQQQGKAPDHPYLTRIAVSSILFSLAASTASILINGYDTAARIAGKIGLLMSLLAVCCLLTTVLMEGSGAWVILVFAPCLIPLLSLCSEFSQLLQRRNKKVTTVQGDEENPRDNIILVNEEPLTTTEEKTRILNDVEKVTTDEEGWKLKHRALEKLRKEAFTNADDFVNKFKELHQLEKLRQSEHQTDKEK